MNLKQKVVFVALQALAMLVTLFTGIKLMAFRPNSGTGFMFAIESVAMDSPVLTRNLPETVGTIHRCLAARKAVNHLMSSHQELYVEGTA